MRAQTAELGWLTELVSRALAVVVSALIVVATVVAVTGVHRWSGPELFPLWASHGVHVGDLAVMGLGAFAVAFTWRSIS